jgi:hypothetical protein
MLISRKLCITSVKCGTRTGLGHFVLLTRILLATSHVPSRAEETAAVPRTTVRAIFDRRGIGELFIVKHRFSSDSGHRHVEGRLIRQTNERDLPRLTLRQACVA